MDSLLGASVLAMAARVSAQSELSNVVGTDESEERYLRETLAILQESYAKAAKPYIDRLVAIHSRRLPRPIMVSLDHTLAIGFDVPNASDKPRRPLDLPDELGEQPDMQGFLRKMVE